MKYNFLGNSGIKVSEICLGTMTWGQQNSESEGHQQIDIALEKGVNFIDTAEMYPVPPDALTCHLTEAYVGNWLKKNSSKRDGLVVATKVCGAELSGPRTLHYIRSGPRLNKAHLQEALEGSLRRLQIDCIDLYQLHWPERKVNNFGQLDYIEEKSYYEEAISILETLEVLNEFVKQGKIKHIGISNESAWGMMQFLSLAEKHSFARIVSIQNCYNLLQRAYDIALSEVSLRENCGLLAYSPLAFGVLSGKYLAGKLPDKARLTLYTGFRRYLNEMGLVATQKYVTLANEMGITASQLAISFTLSRSFVTSSIIGATNLQQLEENIACTDIKLNKDVLQKIEEIHLSAANPCH